MPADNRDRGAHTTRTQNMVALTDVQAKRLKDLQFKLHEESILDVIDKLLEIGEAYDWRPDPEGQADTTVVK